MALPSDEIREDGKRGKAVFVLHTWKDCLWELGGGGDMPEALEVAEAGEKENEEEREGGHEVDSTGLITAPEVIAPTADETPPGAFNGSALSPEG